eukprot:scaffold230304_cov13-Tisochrysis_lutea.AAC.2
MVHKYPCDGRNAGWPGFYQAIYKLTPAIIDGQSCYCNRVFLLPEALRQDQEVNSSNNVCSTCIEQDIALISIRCSKAEGKARK